MNVKLQGLTSFLLFFGVATLEAFQNPQLEKSCILAGDRGCVSSGG